MFYRDPTSDLVWAYVPKNMSSTMSTLAGHYKWQRYDRIEIVPKHLHIFCLIQNPWTRFCKGMAELAWTTNERSFEMVRKNPYYRMSFMNPHLLPINAFLADAQPYLNYVAMDHPAHSATQVLNQLFESHGSRARLTPELNTHVSSPRKQAYQAEVKVWLRERYPYRQQVQYFNRADFENWRAALVALDPVVEDATWFQNFLNWMRGSA